MSEALTKSAALRAMRAALTIGQAEVAAGAGIAERTLLEAERGRCVSVKTWTALVAWYATRGVRVELARTVARIEIASM